MRQILIGAAGDILAVAAIGSIAWLWRNFGYRGRHVRRRRHGPV